MKILSSFDEYYRPQIDATLNRHVTFMEKKVTAAQWTNGADEAERLLGEACDDLMDNVREQLSSIKLSVLRKRPGTTASSEEQRKYCEFAQATAVGVRSARGLFYTIFSRIRNVVRTVADWVRRGVSWEKNKVRDAFHDIRSLFRR